MSNIEEKLLSIVRSETIPAIGCTEPIAVAYASSLARKYLEGDLDSLEVKTSKAIFKNGKSVKIPNTDLSGLELAAITGFLFGNPEKELLVLEDISQNDYKEAERYLDQGFVSLESLDSSDPVHLEVTAASGNNKVLIVLRDAHNHIEKIMVNDQIIHEDIWKKDDMDDNFIKDLSFKEIREIIENFPLEKIDFMAEGIRMNMAAAEEGLIKNLGMELGSSLNRLVEKGVLADDTAMRARIMTTSAADLRMGGDSCPIMTSAGSGNQGISAIIPIVVVADSEDIEEERLLRAVFFAHIINKYVKLYTGKLSYLCGCAIAAGMGASAGISWMLGGDDEVIAGAANNMLANLAGMICDGAKESCALKLGTSSAEAVISAYLAMEGIIVNEKTGIIGSSIEESIENIGKISQAGLPFMDPCIIDIMNK